MHAYEPISGSLGSGLYPQPGTVTSLRTDDTSPLKPDLQDLHALLKENPERAKAEFRRLNLHLRFIPVDYESDNPYYRVEGQCT